MMGTSRLAPRSVKRPELLTSPCLSVPNFRGFSVILGSNRLQTEVFPAKSRIPFYPRLNLSTVCFGITLQVAPRLKLHYIAPRQFPLNLTATKTPATLLEAMTSVNHSRQYVMSDSSSSNRPQQLNSARTPGEGYPFPRTPRPQGNLTVSVSKNPTEIPPSPTTPHRSSIRSSSPSSPIIDTEVFKQLLAMEDENSSFSFTHGLIDLYYEDGSRTLDQMRCALQPSDYSTLARLAHFLRGSAASVGIIQVARICELIEMRIISQQQSLNKEWFESQIAAIEQAHVISQQWFRDFYNQQ
ncbi:hypothetical protein PGT21_013237 [Puccinia graminis f. sp. tritici]|uniref:HPt domain-containing protein n=1 Tax=Puccinia graminis f. sp. tritici TaxID=56615 RepID=A0A5B0PXG1_PUCGR|nr:hypothetical protein PGT21_013237 [Puccinia graminis f. sp. tritici]KAA1125170.1 hypothetical protein PGTUg99_008562 [Puccinia graminis f. sp. tritici]